MDTLLFFLAITIGLAALGIAAAAWGVDSREESSDPRRPAYPVGIQ